MLEHSTRLIFVGLLIGSFCGCGNSLEGEEFKRYSHKYSLDLTVGIPADTVVVITESDLNMQTEAPTFTWSPVFTQYPDSLRVSMDVVGKTPKERDRGTAAVYVNEDTMRIWFAYHSRPEHRPWNVPKKTTPPEVFFAPVSVWVKVPPGIVVKYLGHLVF